MYLLKIEQAAQAAQIPGLVGKSFTVGDVTTTGAGGINKWLVLNPDVATGAAKGSVMLKVEGGRQLPALVGKTFTVGKSPIAGAGGAKWLALYPGATAAKGAAVSGVAAATAKGSVILSIDNANGGFQALTGKTFTVGKAQIAGQNTANMLVLNPANAAAGKSSIIMNVNNANGGLHALAGKTFVVGKSPVMAQGASNMLVLNPVSGVAAKSAAAAGVATGAKGVVTKGVIAGKTAGTAGKTLAVGTVAAKTTAATGTIWAGTGLGLGLGLGLGAMGPAIVLTALTAGGYYLYKKSGVSLDASIEEDLEEAIA